MDPNHLGDVLRKLRRKGERPKAIVPVHLFGLMADMEAILEIAHQYEVPVVEDAAQALGAYQEGAGVSTPKIRRMAGTVGDLGCFSFYPSKNLGAFGDGGMVVTRNPALAEKIRILRVHGGRTKYNHEVIGINSRLDALQAAVLRVKLKYLDQWSKARRRNAQRYERLFQTEGGDSSVIELPMVPKGNYHIFNQFVIRVRRRDELRHFLTQHGIGSDVYYPIPLHLQVCYRDLGYRAGDFPISEKAARETLALPIYPELTLRQQRRVVQTIRDFYSQGRRFPSKAGTAR
jgi:dTDP-4-amino-4,6-dideoxygalactose transaminase